MHSIIFWVIVVNRARIYDQQINAQKLTGDLQIEKNQKNLKNQLRVEGCFWFVDLAGRTGGYAKKGNMPGKVRTVIKNNAQLRIKECDQLWERGILCSSLYTSPPPFPWELSLVFDPDSITDQQSINRYLFVSCPGGLHLQSPGAVQLHF